MADKHSSLTFARNKRGKLYIVRRTLPGGTLPGFDTWAGRIGWTVTALTALPVTVLALPGYLLWVQAFRRVPKPAHAGLFLGLVVTASIVGSRGAWGAGVVWLNALRRLPKMPPAFGKQTLARHRWQELSWLAPAYALLAYYPLVIYAHDQQDIAKLGQLT